MKKKRLLSILFSLALMLTMMPAPTSTVLAKATSGDTCGQQIGGVNIDGSHVHDNITFEKWESTNSLPNTAGNYYLTNDIIILGAWDVPSGTTHLCLNGHTIKAVVNYAHAINIGDGAELHIYDEAEKTGKITAQGGTGVRLNGGTFVMHGGRVSECTWGGVYIANGTFILEDGSVQNNNWNNSGAGVKIAGSTARFIMNGGSVTGNNCNGSYGGGVHVGSIGAYFEMNGGSITGNTCDRGSGGDGGGVYVNYGTFKMTGGSISGNKAAGHYGGVFIGENGIFELSGNVEINGNVGACNSEDPLSENLYLSSSRIIISGEMTNSDPIDIDMNALGGGVFTQSKNDVKASDYADKFVSAKKGFLVKAEGDELKLANEEPFTYLDSDGIEHTIDSYAYFSSVDITRSIPLNEKWYVVDGEFEVNNTIYINGKVNLILCDDAVLDAKKGITVPNTGKINCTLGIYAKSTGDHTGRLIASGGNNDPGIGGGYAPCGIINIYGGNIKAVGGTGAAGIGGRENFIGGTVRIYGGTLEAIAGENAAAIGAGNGTDDHGTVTLGEKVKVLAGDDEANAEDVTSTFAEKHDQKWVKTAVRQTVTRTVTFKVVNGSWNEYEEEAAVSDNTVELTGMEGDTLNLAEDQIPAAGDKPNAGYKAGSWDTVPSTDTEITADTIYTYTYAAREASDDVIDAINALPAKTTASDKTKVEAARKAYNELNPEQKAKVPVETLVKLENAETVLNALDKEDKAEKAKTDAEKARDDAVKAEEDAEAAQKAAEDAQKTAEASQKAAEEAAAQATKDKETAEAAAEQARKESSAAKEAQAKAEELARAAEAAKAQAEADKEAAETAAASAAAAQTVAEEKAKSAEEAKAKAEADKKAVEEAAAKQAAAELEAAKTQAQEALDEEVTVKQKGRKFTVKWNKTESADGYHVYAQYGTEKADTPVKTIKKNTKTKVKISKINGKKISGKKNFYVYVEAYKIVDGKEVVLAKSTTANLVGAKDTKYSNVKKLILKKSEFNLNVGDTEKIKAKVKLVDKSKKHMPDSYSAKFRYKSSDEGIATVTKYGTIEGVKAGTCTIYVYSSNGLMKKAEVTVA